jgi:uncharacterized protein (DUF2141 family)
MIKTVLLAAMTMQNAYAGDITVTVKRAPETCAPLLVAVFDSKETFLDEPAYKDKAQAARGAVVRFTGIPGGVYAVSAFCDNNGNGDIDKASFGKPIEPHGMSRNAKGHMGPPRFEDAAFIVGDDQITVPLILR